MKQELPQAAKKSYDGKDISALEKLVEDSRHLSRGAGKEMIEVLFYLQVTNRFKENKQYAHSSFNSYIGDRWGIIPAMYIEQKRAFLNFPKESIEHGVGFVSKAIRICGDKRVREVFREIAKAEELRPISRERKNAIMEERKDPKRIKSPQPKWKVLYESEVIAHEKTKEALREAMAQINEQREQIEKLKVTAGIIVKVREAMKEGAAKEAQI